MSRDGEEGWGKEGIGVIGQLKGFRINKMRELGMGEQRWSIVVVNIEYSRLLCVVRYLCFRVTVNKRFQPKSKQCMNRH